MPEDFDPEKFTKDDQKAFSSETAIFIALSVSFICFFVVPFVSSKELFPWIEFLNKYQTLIGGVLAIFAAILTIGQMRKSDEVNQKRHDQLIELSLRGEHLQVARAINPSLPKFSSSLRELKNIYIKMENNFEGIEGIIYSYCEEISDPLFNMVYIFESESFKLGKIHLYGETLFLIDLSERGSRQILDLMGFKKGSPYKIDDMDKSNTYIIYAELQILINNLSNLVDDLNDIDNELNLKRFRRKPYTFKPIE
jgi:hypothetical protein